MSLPKNVDRGKSNLPIGSLDFHDKMPATRCATITGRGRSAIGVIALGGPLAARIVTHCFQGATKVRFSPGQIRYGDWTGPDAADGGRPDADAAESVVVTPIADDHFEIHCHGGPAAITRIVGDLQALGATLTEPHLWMGCSENWMGCSENVLIREAMEVLCQCMTAKTAAIVMDQVRGAMLDWAMKQLSELEDGRITINEIQREADEILSVAGFTTRLAEPFRLVLVGPPNVGKSSLLNAMVGFDRSITLDSPGTTRDVLHTDTVIDGLPIRLSDTAGIRQSDESIEKQGVERARCAAANADLLLIVAEPTSTGQRGISAADLQSLVASSKPLIRVLNKSDLLQNGHDQAYDVATNALTGEGVEQLLVCIADKLGGGMSSRETRNGPAAVTDRQAGLLRQLVASRDAGEIAALFHELLGVGDASE